MAARGHVEFVQETVRCVHVLGGHDAAAQRCRPGSRGHRSEVQHGNCAFLAGGGHHAREPTAGCE
eukprot:4979790-Prorocentrum_lima.AAC.1